MLDKFNRVVLFFLSTTLFITLFSVDIKAEDNLPDICVRGIIADMKSPLVIINGETFWEGDDINGLIVVKISGSRVKFERDGKVFYKELGDGCRGVINPIHRKNINDATRKLRGAAVFNNFGESSLDIKFNNEVFRQGALILGILLLLIVIGYVFSAIALQMIARKTETKKGWLAWIPIASLFLVCMIAKKSFWWLLLLLLPLGNIISGIVLGIGVAEARQKPGWLGALIILPFINLFIIGYLAFSK